MSVVKWIIFTFLGWVWASTSLGVEPTIDPAEREKWSRPFERVLEGNGRVVIHYDLKVGSGERWHNAWLAFRWSESDEAVVVSVKDQKKDLGCWMLTKADLGRLAEMAAWDADRDGPNLVDDVRQTYEVMIFEGEKLVFRREFADAGEPVGKEYLTIRSLLTLIREEGSQLRE